jgi:ABC-type branched-subunit amino acid transport system substrate-binding protein
MTHYARPRALAPLASIVAVALLAAGCGAFNRTTPPTTDLGAGSVRLYGSDGNMISGFGAAFKDKPGLLNGMKGTTPLNPVADDFKRRLRTVDPGLQDFNYAGEAYDAVMLAALAAETAHSTDGPQIAKYLTGVTIAKGPNAVTCDTAHSCLEAARSGKDIAYRGMSIKRAGLTERGDPSTASYATLTFDRNNQIDDAKTEFVGAGDEHAEAADQPALPPTNSTAGKAKPLPLKIGALLPHTGDLAFAGPPLFAGAQLAVHDINEAGGVAGAPVQWLDGDDGTDPKVASATVDRHLAAGVQVIIGAAASGITKVVLPKVTQAGRVLISPSATSDELSTLDDKGLFFRTSPPDTLQAKALVDTIMRYGAQRVAIVAREDSYGTGLRDNVVKELKAAGIKPDLIKPLGYQVRETYGVQDFATVAADTTKFRPDAVLVIGFEESSNVIKALASRGMTFHD